MSVHYRVEKVVNVRKAVPLLLTDLLQNLQHLENNDIVGAHVLISFSLVKPNVAEGHASTIAGVTTAIRSLLNAELKPAVGEDLIILCTGDTRG